MENMHSIRKILSVTDVCYPTLFNISQNSSFEPTLLFWHQLRGFLFFEPTAVTQETSVTLVINDNGVKLCAKNF